MQRLLVSFFSFVALIVLTASGCGEDKAIPDDFFGNGPIGDGGDGDVICLINNCTEDFHCKDCTGNRTVCEKESRRCIACGPAAGGRTCPQGYSCTKYGDCVPEGTVCLEDAAGNPTVSCTTNAQCAACAPQFRVCDAAAKKCISCTPNDTSQCQRTDYCKDGRCTARCPDVCQNDNDCTQCGAGARTARSCVRGKCVQCNPERSGSCPAGLSCTPRGTCQAVCGVGMGMPGPQVTPGVAAACMGDNDCGACRREKNCDQPINGGFGRCAVPAPGCSELARGFFVLPEPYDKVTNLCSTDMDCRGVGADYNVGKELREFTGVPFIGNANISYDMNVCASVDIIGSRSCGVCVPCRKDTDCKSIDMERLGGQLAGSLGKAAIAKTMDTVFGRNDHKIHFYCETLAGNYGICLPCGNPLSRCGDDPAPPTGPCNHDVCRTGERLGIQCNSCTGKICEKDPYCCTNKWDPECVRKTETLCDGYPSCRGQSCEGKRDGWYCTEAIESGTNNRGRGTYECKNGSLVQGQICPRTPNSDFYCHPLNNDWKKTAELAGDGRPQCFTTPAPVPQ